jgi:anti-anti-sigma factor
MSTLSLATFRQNGDLLVSVAGELDAETVWQLNAAVRSETPRAERIIIDLRHIIHMDSIGRAAIAAADSQTRQTGQELVIVRAPADVERWLWLTNRDDRVRIVDDLAAVIGPQVQEART